MLNFSQVMFSEIDVKNKIAVGSYNCLDVILQNNCLWGLHGLKVSHKLGKADCLLSLLTSSHWHFLHSYIAQFFRSVKLPVAWRNYNSWERKASNGGGIKIMGLFSFINKCGNYSIPWTWVVLISCKIRLVSSLEISQTSGSLYGRQDIVQKFCLEMYRVSEAATELYDGFLHLLAQWREITCQPSLYWTEKPPGEDRVYLFPRIPISWYSCFCILQLHWVYFKVE
jgi:hypothetical protein